LRGVLADQQGEIPSLLSHPVDFWLRSATCELHTSRAQMDEEQRVIGERNLIAP